MTIILINFFIAVNGESFQDDGKKIDEDDEEEELPECLKQLQKVSDAQGFVGWWVKLYPSVVMLD